METDAPHADNTLRIRVSLWHGLILTACVILPWFVATIIILNKERDCATACGGLWWWCASLPFFMLVRSLIGLVGVDEPLFVKHDRLVLIVVLLMGLVITVDLLHRGVADDGRTCQEFYNEQAPQLLYLFQAVFWILSGLFAVHLNYSPKFEWIS